MNILGAQVISKNPDAELELFTTTTLATCSEEETDNHLDSLNTGNLEDVWNHLGVESASGRQGWTPILFEVYSQALHCKRRRLHQGCKC